MLTTLWVLKYRATALGFMTSISIAPTGQYMVAVWVGGRLGRLHHHLMAGGLQIHYTLFFIHKVKIMDLTFVPHTTSKLTSLCV